MCAYIVSCASKYNTSILFLQLTKDYYWKGIFSDVQEYCKLYETCQHVNKTTKFREQYQERARANSKSPEKNPEIPSRKQIMTAAALKDEKRIKQRRKGLKEGRRKIHRYLLRIKIIPSSCQLQFWSCRLY